MKKERITILSIVSIITILLAIGLVYTITKPPEVITTTSISYILTTNIITTTSYIPTTYISTTFIPTTIIRTNTQIITTTTTYTPPLSEKIEVSYVSFEEENISDTSIKLNLFFHIENKGNLAICIDPKRNITIVGKGLHRNNPRNFYWSILAVKGINSAYWIDMIDVLGPFIIAGSPYYSQVVKYGGTLYHNKWFDDFDPNMVAIGENYTISFDYKVIYPNETFSDWKTFTFNATLKEWRGQ